MSTRLKKIVGWIVVIGMFLTPTLALAEGEKEFFAASTEENTISETDLKLLFGQDAVNEYGNSVQLAMLTDTEMKEIEGARVKLIISLAKNIAFDGPKGGRVFQVRYQKQPVFRVDYHPNPYTTTLHFHFGDMKLHRPWYTPWRGY